MLIWTVARRSKSWLSAVTYGIMHCDTGYGWSMLGCLVGSMCLACSLVVWSRKQWFFFLTRLSHNYIAHKYTFLNNVRPHGKCLLDILPIHLCDEICLNIWCYDEMSAVVCVTLVSSQPLSWSDVRVVKLAQLLHVSTFIICWGWGLEYSHLTHDCMRHDLWNLKSV